MQRRTSKAGWRQVPPQPCTLFLDLLRNRLGLDLQASTGPYRLSTLWKGLRNRKGAGDWEGTGFI